jgi:hypothetical protein
MRSVLLLATVMPFLGLASSSSAEQPRKPPPEPKNDAGRVAYWGVVTELTKDSITIQFAEDKPKRFPVSATLAAGKVPKEPTPIPGRRDPYLVAASMMYRLTDVKVGDRVDIEYSIIDGVVTCDHICIKKRPGGRVPPLPEEAEALRGGKPRPSGIPRLYIPYHEYMNAYWDLEDKGIPQGLRTIFRCDFLEHL